jgi:hypothetical protein
MAVKKNNKTRQANTLCAWLEGAPAGIAGLLVNERNAGSAGEQIYARDWPALVAADKRELAEFIVEQSEAWAEAAGRECGFIARFVSEKGEYVSAHQWRVSGLEAGEITTPYDGTAEGMLKQMQGHVQHLMKVNTEQMRMVVEALREANVFQATRIKELENMVRLTNGVSELRILQEHAQAEMSHDTIRMEAALNAAPRLLEAFAKKDPLGVITAANDLRKAVQGSTEGGPEQAEPPPPAPAEPPKAAE